MLTDPRLQITALLLAAFAVLIAMFVRLSHRSPLCYVALVYFYLSFGPVVNYLFDEPVYVGVIHENIPIASFVFFLGLCGMLISSMMFGSSVDTSSPALEPAVPNERTALPWILVALSIVTCLLLARLGSLAFSYDKLAKIEAVGPRIHYAYLLVQLCMVSLYFSARRSRFIYRVYVVDVILYVIYSIAMSERDFMFALASVAAHRLLLGEIQLNFRTLALGTGGVYLGTLMFSMRFEDVPVDAASLLGQGSLLFVTTYVIYLVPDFTPFLSGESYVSAIIGLLPATLSGERRNLLTWFQDWYAPDSASGYGFSLDAEAFLNFGLWGVLIVFSLLAAVQLLVLRRFGRSPFATYFSVFFTAHLMYSFRNDSWILVHGCVYALVVFILAQTYIKESQKGIKA
jgi:hypothetical protein